MMGVITSMLELELIHASKWAPAVNEFNKVHFMLCTSYSIKYADSLFFVLFWFSVSLALNKHHKTWILRMQIS